MNKQKYLTTAPATIARSLTNPRKDFTKRPDWPDFVASVRTHGVKQPPLARPLPAARAKEPGMKGVLYELIAGERRWTAATEVKLPEIGLMVEDLNDAQVFEIQQIENLQREDLTALEEAAGYEEWCVALQHAGTAKTKELAVAHICEKISKKRSHVFGRMALLKVSEPVKQAIMAGELEATKAQLIAQVPGAEEQAELLKNATGKGDYDALSYRDLKEEIEKNYRITLKGAPFKTTEVYHGAGIFKHTCTVCPYRTGNMHGVEGSPEVCTMPSCFQRKCAAVASTASATLAGVWDEKTWKKNRYNREYVEAGESCYEDMAQRPWAKVLGNFAPLPIVAMGRRYTDESPDTEVLLLNYYKRADVLRIVKDNKLIKERAAEKERKPTAADLKRDKEREEEKARETLRTTAVAKRLTEIVGGGACSVLAANQVLFWRTMAQTAFHHISENGDEDAINDIMKGHGMGHQILEDDQKNVDFVQARLTTEPSWENLLGYCVEFMLRDIDGWVSYGNKDGKSDREIAMALWPLFKGTARGDGGSATGNGSSKPSLKTAKQIVADAKKTSKPARPVKMSTTTKARIASQAKARWAKVKAAAGKKGK